MAERKRKIRVFIFLDKKFRNIINSNEISFLINKFNENYEEKTLQIKLQKNIEWIKKYIVMDDKEFDEWNKFQEIANRNKISSKLLLRLLIEEYVKKKDDPFFIF
jgi:hypothetical protein